MTRETKKEPTAAEKRLAVVARVINANVDGLRGWAGGAPLSEIVEAAARLATCLYFTPEYDAIGAPEATSGRLRWTLCYRTALMEACRAAEVELVVTEYNCETTYIGDKK